MKYFAALLKMRDAEKNAIYREQHMAFLQKTDAEGKIFARGRFADGGGLVIYVAPSFEEAERIAKGDPFVVNGARTLELYEWEMKVSQNR